MYKTFTKVVLVSLIWLCGFNLYAQQTDHVQDIQQKLEKLSALVPGLNQKVQLLVTGVSIREYLNALARSNNLSISADQALSFPIYDTFNGVTAANILVLLSQKYNLDIAVVGSIIYITPYRDPNLFIKPAPKEINVKYDPQGNLLSLELDNDSLPAVAKKIIQISGKNVIVPPALQSKRLTAFISKAPFETAMEKLAYTNDLKMVKTSDNFFLFQPLGENEELYVNGDHNTSVRKNFRILPSAAPGSGGGSTGLFVRMLNGRKVISADAINAPIQDLVKQAFLETGKSYSLYSDLKGALTLHVSDMDFESFLRLVFRSTDYTFHSEEGVYIVGDRKLEGLRSFKTIHLQNRSIDTLVAMIPTEWKRGVEIKEFREQNTLLVSGSSAQIAEIENFVRQLDVLVPVVLIEVTVIDIRKNRVVSTGISAGVSDSAKTGGTVFPGLNYTFGSKSINSFLHSVSGLNLGRVTPNFYVTLSALEANDNINVRSVPQLAAMNGHIASLAIGNKRYYKNTTQNVIPSVSNNQSIFTNVYQEVNANLAINIKPVVSGDNQVTLGISVNISDFTSIPTDGSPPPQSISKFETSLRVHSEDTIVLGGLERTADSESGSGVPVLSRIPVLKWLFSSHSKTNNKVITVLLIKSSVIL